MTDDLVKRLNEWIEWEVLGVTASDIIPIRDRIEALERERETLVQAHDAMVETLRESGRKRIAAEARLAKAVEALRPFAEALKGNYSHQSDDLLISMGHGKDDLRWILPLGDFRRAVATLAEIEGGKKDE
jgi:hypothetical protein